MKMTGAQIICEMLKLYKIDMVAGIPGGSILPLYDELPRSGIKHILVRQEQAAGFIAQGVARSTGKVAVCMATSGPGAMNLLTAIADARCDSIPIIAITGQVNTSLIGTDAFQEADTFGLSFPITKHSIMVKSAKELLTAIPQAFEIATNGRPGPVLIDVPRNVQLEKIEVDSLLKYKVKKQKVRFHTQKVEMAKTLCKIKDTLFNAKHPVLFLGGGCASREASSYINEFLAMYDAVVVTSLMGLGVVPSSFLGNVGMVGMHGSIAANRAMFESDLVLAVGVRFDDRAVGMVEKFCPNAKVIHIDIDAAEIHKIVKADYALVSDVCSAFSALNELLRETIFSSKTNAVGGSITNNDTASKSQNWDTKKEARAEWKNKMAELRKKTFSQECGQYKKSEFINPRTFIATLSEKAAHSGTSLKDIIVTTDVGQHQMWAAQYYPVEEPQTFLTSGSLGTMGFGLPCAIGAALANPKKRVVCFSGDGSILMNVQELATLKELNLNVVIIVFENGTLGMVRQQQKYLFSKNYSASVFQKSPDLLSIAKGFGIEPFDGTKDDSWIEKVFSKKHKGPSFVRIKIDPEEDVLPFVKAGCANVDSIN